MGLDPDLLTTHHIKEYLQYKHWIMGHKSGEGLEQEEQLLLPSNDTIRASSKHGLGS